MSSISGLTAPLTIVDLTSYTFAQAHYQLGETVGPQVRRILRQKLDMMDSARLQVAFSFAANVHKSLLAKSTSSIVQAEVRQALLEYVECLQSWASGVGLEAFNHSTLDDLGISDSEKALHLALFLQDDTSGCQTGVYRDADGSVVMWHTEEEVQEDRFDELRMAVFSFTTGQGQVTLWSFIYPDLLPGPAFAWRSDGFVLAVDSLYLQPELSGEILANVAAWVAVRLGSTVDLVTIVTSLAPFRDGYGLTVVSLHKTRGIAATRIEFAGEMSLLVPLPAIPNEFLFQVNVFSDKESAIAQRYERINAAERCEYEKRIWRTERWMCQRFPDEHVTETFLRLLRSRRGGKYAYSNSDVKAYCVVRLSENMLEAYVGLGMASAQTTPITIRLSMPR